MAIIDVKVGDEFGVGYVVLGDYFIYFTESHNSDLVVLLDKQEITYQEQPEQPMEDNFVSWYLFKATNTGNTQITVNYFQHLAITPIPKVYNITIK